MVHLSVFPTPIGHCGIAWRDDLVVATQLPERTAAATLDQLSLRTGGEEAEPEDNIRQAINAITSLLHGNATDLNHIACDFGGVEPFAADVYGATRTIPAGETQTYGDIAVLLGDKRLAQAVGRVLGRNPQPIVVPCHRVVGADGKLTGFSAYGGVETKLKMLTIEGAVGITPALF